MKKLSTLFLVFCCFVNISSAQIPTDYLGYYSFEGNVEDASSNNLHGTEHGTTINYETGKYGQAIEFNNVNHGAFDVNDYVSFPAISVNEFTVAFWAYYRNSSYTGQGGTSTLFSMGNTKLDTALNVIHKKDWGGLRAELVSEFDDGDLTYYATDNSPIVTNSWEHIVIKFNSSTLKLYVNGDFVFEKALSFVPDFNEKPFFIAYHEWHGGNFNASRYNGLIDDLYIYDRFLSDDEIKDIYNNETATSIFENNNKENINVYPNPSSEFVVLDIESDQIKDIKKVNLLNVTGQLQKIDYSIQNNKLVFNIEHLAKGMYFIELEVFNTSYNSKFIKE